MHRREILGFLKRGVIYGLASPSIALPRDHGFKDLVKNPSLFYAAVGCSKAAEACFTHCGEVLAQGDNSLALCARNSREVLVVCNALRALAAQNSPHLVPYARLSAQICNACETECRKHPEHAACRNCADACSACAVECGRFA